MLGLPFVVRCVYDPGNTGWATVTIEPRFVRLGEPGWSAMQQRRVKLRWNSESGNVYPPLLPDFGIRFYYAHLREGSWIAWVRHPTGTLREEGDTLDAAVLALRARWAIASG